MTIFRRWRQRRTRTPTRTKRQRACTATPVQQPIRMKKKVFYILKEEAF